MEPIKIHPYDLAEIINSRSDTTINIFKSPTDPALDTDYITFDGQIYVQDVSVPRKLSGIN